MQDDVQVFGGAELQPCLFHRQARGCAANQDVLIDVCRKPLLENVQASHLRIKRFLATSENAVKTQIG